MGVPKPAGIHSSAVSELTPSAYLHGDLVASHRTETFDDIGKVGEDPRWNTLLDLHKYIDKRFPLVLVPTVRV